jgi:Cu/Ag efflux protein CusF
MSFRIHTLLLLAALTAGVSSQVMAQTDHSMHAMPVAKPAASSAEAPMAEALVKKIDKAKGTVTLAHGALPNGMPPMTMAYKVKNAAWLDKMTVGQKIRFATDPKDGDMTVVRFESVK